MRINECQVGATRQALTKQMIEDWQVPLPPLEEQQRVVAEIEKQFTRLEVGLAALRRVQANLKRYRAAVLKAACEGHLVPTEAELARAEGLPFESGQQLLARILTERHQNWQGRGRYEEPEPPDTEGLPALPEGWAYATVEQLGIVGEQAVLTGPFGTNLTSADFTDSGVPVLTISCLKDTGIKMEKADFVSENKAIELERYRLAPGDLLFSRMASVGRAGIVGESLRGALFNYHIMRLRLEPSVLLAKFYLAYVRGASQVEQYLKKVNHGATRAGINTEQLLHMPVVLPPLAEQTRIVPEVERRLSVVEELEAVVTTNLERAKRLRGSILAGGFRSERGADKGPLQSKVKPAPSRQTDQPIRQIISTMKNNLKLSPEALVETVRRNKGRMTPAELCLASHVEEEVEGFFEVLRECRDQGLLVVPSGIGGIIKLAKS
jgi:type I restriction enzyme, S subunit